MGLEMVPVLRSMAQANDGAVLIEVTDETTGKVAGFALLVLPEFEAPVKTLCENINAAPNLYLEQGEKR